MHDLVIMLVWRLTFFWALLLLCASAAVAVADQSTHNATVHASPTNHNLGMEAVHGWLLWASMSFVMPIGAIIIRMSKLSAETGASLKTMETLYSAHLYLQLLAFALSAVGGGISLRYLGNTFGGTHSRLGLALYILAWLMPIHGFFVRPTRGTPCRSIWYFTHWLIGHATIILGVVNTYIGIRDHERHLHKNLQMWNVLFSIQVAIMATIYLLQDRWFYMLDQSDPVQKPGEKSPQKAVHDRELSQVL